MCINYSHSPVCFAKLCWVDIEGCADLFFTQVEEICTKCTKLHTFHFNTFKESPVDHRNWIALKTVKFPHIGFSHGVNCQIERLVQIYKWFDRHMGR